MAKSIDIISYLLLIGKLRADQPVSCLGQAEGAWNFHISAEIQNINLYDSSEICTHKLPNKLQILNQYDNFKFDKEEVWQVSLNQDMTATVQGNPAKWMAFYDQALKIDIDDETRLLTNYRYSIKEYVEGDPSKDGSKNLG